MSRLVDEQRREDALQARVERAKQDWALYPRLGAWLLEGVPKAEQARRLGISREKLERILACAGLSTRVEAVLGAWLKSCRKREVRDGCEAET